MSATFIANGSEAMLLGHQRTHRAALRCAALRVMPAASGRVERAGRFRASASPTQCGLLTAEFGFARAWWQPRLHAQRQTPSGVLEVKPAAHPPSLALLCGGPGPDRRASCEPACTASCHRRCCSTRRCVAAPSRAIEIVYARQRIDAGPRQPRSISRAGPTCTTCRAADSRFRRPADPICSLSAAGDNCRASQSIARERGERNALMHTLETPS